MTLEKGRLAKPVTIVSMRTIAREDLPRLKTRDRSASIPQRLRESHHFVARLLALGLEQSAISLMTGFSVTRISQLAQAPAMIEQIALYVKEVQGKVIEDIDTFTTLATQNMIAAERQVLDHITDADANDELLPLRELRAIVADRADRFGYGKHTTSTNVNVDFASRLEAAIQRSGKTIEANGRPQLGPRISSSPPSSVLPYPSDRIRRLA
jgi:hypothetical protein